MVTKLLFVEPPKDYWFLMGEYLPPPTGLLILAAYLEGRITDMEIEILDCRQKERILKMSKNILKAFHLRSLRPQDLHVT